jgi:hypothetical protein
MDLTRRDLVILALGVVPATPLLARLAAPVLAASQAAGKPNSMFSGVQIGVSAPSSFAIEPADVDGLLKQIGQLGVSAVELESTVVEAFAGAPGLSAAPAAAAGRGGRGGGGRGGPPAAAGAAAPARGGAADQQTADTLRRWRATQSMSKYRDLRKKFDEAGVSIQIVNFNLGPASVDQEIDYCFQVAKTLGARAVSCEPPVREATRLGLFADKNQTMIGYHGKSDVTTADAFGRPGAWEQAFFYTKLNGAIVNLGQFTAGNNRSPVSFIQEYHDRIASIRLTDRKMNQGPSVPWGQGDTEIREVLQLMRREKYTFQATIDLDYQVPEGSTRGAEIAKCVAYCKAALA